MGRVQGWGQREKERRTDREAVKARDRDGERVGVGAERQTDIREAGKARDRDGERAGVGAERERETDRQRGSESQR